MTGRRASGRGVSRRGAGVAAATLFVAGLGACDDQIKHVPWFETMYRQASVETYERPMTLPPEGAVPLGAERHSSLIDSDSLANPLAGRRDAATLERGQILYQQYCVVCHGQSGAGDGPVVGENRLPALPTLDLTSERAVGLTDGYLWGMIANGRGVMPSYRRIPADDRWYIVNYVRQLQGNP